MGAGSLMTDGTWLWPIDLAHCVRRHHVALPPAFTDHIRTHGYTAPAVPEERAQEILREVLPSGSHEPRRPTQLPDPFLTWHLAPLTVPAATLLLDRLEASGITAAHPRTGQAFGFGETTAGRREPLLGPARATLPAALGDGRRTTVEFLCWQGYDQCLTGTARRPGEKTQSITLRLRGMTGPEHEGVIAALTRTFDPEVLGCLGFVVDRTGATAAEDWEGVLTGAGPTFTVRPDTLGILRAHVPSHPELVGRASAPHGPLEVFHRDR